MSVAFHVAQTGTRDTGTANLPITIPGGASVGDQLIVVIETPHTASLFTWTPPSGWTQDVGVQTSTCAVYVFHKAAVPADIGATLTFTSDSATRSVWTVRAYSGAELVSVLDPAAPATTTDAALHTSVTAPAITTGTAGVMSVEIFAVQSSTQNPAESVTWTPPAGYGNTQTVQTASTTNPNLHMLTVDELLGAAGTYGPDTATISLPHQSIAVHLGLKARTIDTPPVASAVANPSTQLGTFPVTLDATASYDPDNAGPLSYVWTQVDGDPQVIPDGDPNAIEPTYTFIAPNVTTSLTFRCAVTDAGGNTTISSPVNVSITPAGAWTPRVRDTLVTAVTNSTAAPSCSIPATVQLGDVMILYAASNNQGVSPVTAPAGWTLLGTVNSGAAQNVLMAWWKVATATDAKSTVTLTSTTAGRWVLTWRAFYDVDNTNPFDVAAVTYTGSNQTPTAGSLTSDLNAALSVVAFADAYAGGSSYDMAWTTPTNYTDAATGSTTNATLSNPYMAVYDRLLGLAGATGSIATSISVSRQWTAMHLILRPKTTNTPPTANAGSDQTVNPNATVILNGSGTDVDGQTLTFSWSQISGPSVTLTGNGNLVSFVAPALANAADLTFRLSVSDGIAQTTDDCVVHINPQNEWVVAGGSNQPGVLY